MLKRIEAGYDPIDISIEKWLDIEKGWSSGENPITSAENCALCHFFAPRCDKCPVCMAGELNCDNINSAYREAKRNRDVYIMLDALDKAKQWASENRYKYNDLLIDVRGDKALDSLTVTLYNITKEMDLHVGDEVRIVKEIKSNSNGWTNSWVDTMTSLIGRTGIIEDIKVAEGTTKAGILVRAVCTTFWYHPLSLEKITETYKRGDVFDLDGAYHILTQTGANLCCLVGLTSGNRYREPIHVEDCFAITRDELQNMYSHMESKIEKIVVEIIKLDGTQ